MQSCHNFSWINSISICIRVLQRKSNNRRYIYIGLFVCKLETQESQWYDAFWIWRPENQGVNGVCLSPSLKAQIISNSTVWGQERTDVPDQADSRFTLPPRFCSIQAFSRLEDVHALWWGPPSLFRLPIQMLISSGNTLKDTLRNNVLLAIRTSLSPIKLTHKIHYHSIHTVWLCKYWVLLSQVINFDYVSFLLQFFCIFISLIFNAYITIFP